MADIGNAQIFFIQFMFPSAMGSDSKSGLHFGRNHFSHCDAVD